MSKMNVALSVLLILGWMLAFFLGTELQQKFAFLGKFTKDTRAMVVYAYPGAERMGIPKGMRNIVLRSADHKTFRALIALKFEFALIGKTGSVDPYGYVCAEKGMGGTVVISTYFGKGPADFVFLVIHDDGSAASVSVSSTDEDQRLTPDVTYPMNWFQTFGPLS